MKESKFQKWGEFLSSLAVVGTIIGGIFAAGEIWDTVSSGIAQAEENRKQINIMEPRLARIEQKVDDIHNYLLDRR